LADTKIIGLKLETYFDTVPYSDYWIKYLLLQPFHQAAGDAQKVHFSDDPD